jgi:hypothetical protein
LKRKLQKKLHHSLKYFIFIFVNRTNTRKWARHLMLLLGEFIYSQSQTRNEMTSFWFAAAARDSYIWLKPGLIYEKVNLLIVERLRRRFHQVKIIFLLRW